MNGRVLLKKHAVTLGWVFAVVVLTLVLQLVEVFTR